ncbi:hypothetical protein H4582DRAFT_2073188 [Lactarius indigo]|nr:hypothetical protein H4582DRAFT_2073188 [Lactarius indigo]
MVDWQKITTIEAESAVINLVHVISGIYIWEIVTRLGFEYSVITRRRKFTWSFPLYLGCRWFPLFSITFQILSIDVSHKIDCQAYVLSAFAFAYLSFMCASAIDHTTLCKHNLFYRCVLYALQPENPLSAVLWDRSKIIIPFACTVWIGNTSVYVYSLTSLRAIWIEICAGSHAPKTCGVWGLLCTQGLIWVIIVTLAEVPPTVFILLNLNGPMNMIFQSLGLIIAPLGAARLYRGLVDYPVSNGLTVAVNEPHDELVSPFSHQTYRTKQHDAEGGSVVLDILPAKTYGSEVPMRETFEGASSSNIIFEG